MSNSAFIKDDKVWQKMKKNLIKGQSLAAKVGVFDKYYGEENDNLPVAQVFQWQEEGTAGGQGNGSGIPMRPAIRYFIMQLEKEGKFIPFISKYLNSVAMGTMTWTQLYEKIGEAAAKDLKEVVVIGYGKQKKRELTGAVAVVDSKIIENLKHYNKKN